MTSPAAKFANKIRAHALRMVSKANASHIGTCLSMADILAALYTEHLRIKPKNPKWTDRDRFILSKGHGAAIVYAALAEKGFFPKKWLKDYCQDGSPLTGHISHHVPGVEVSTGSLGHGLPIGCGMALAAKRDHKNWRTFVLLSDGELDEGSNWEAILFAPHHRLDNLVAIVDYNKIQSFGAVKDVLDLEPLADKWRAFGWEVREVDGHNHEQLDKAFQKLPFVAQKPSVLIAHTVKGKGISYMEHQLAWHYRAPNAELLEKALLELGEEP
jgi:transketolase